MEIFGKGDISNFCGSCESADSDKYYQAKIRDENGTPLFFSALSKVEGTFTPIAKSYAKGETNLGREIIGGKTSLRNYRAKICKDQETVVLKTGGGVLKTFTYSGCNDFDFHRYHKFARLDTPSGFSIDLSNRVLTIGQRDHFRQIPRRWG